MLSERAMPNREGVASEWAPWIVRGVFLLAALLLAGAAGGCALNGASTASPSMEEFEGRMPSPPIRSDSSRYHVAVAEQELRVTIEVTFTNPRAERVYIPSCRGPHPPILEKWEGGDWVVAYDPPVLMCIGDPVIIEPGRSYTYTYRISGAPGNGVHPRLLPSEIAGTYRLQWGLLRGWRPEGPGFGTLLPLEQRVSGTFALVPEP